MDKDKTIHEVASYICEKYDILLATFNEITAYGKEYFEQKRFHEHHAQQQNRYRLYGNYVKDVYAKTQSLLLENLYNVAYWIEIKKQYSLLIKDKPHRLNSETFYNSITRKVFFDKSFNADIEYFDYTDYKPMPKMDNEVFVSASKIRSSAAFGEIIILIVYIPILTLIGIEGKMFRPMAQTVLHGIAQLGKTQPVPIRHK